MSTKFYPLIRQASLGGSIIFDKSPAAAEDHKAPAAAQAGYGLIQTGGQIGGQRRGSGHADHNFDSGASGLLDEFITDA